MKTKYIFKNKETSAIAEFNSIEDFLNFLEYKQKGKKQNEHRN